MMEKEKKNKTGRKEKKKNEQRKKRTLRGNRIEKK